MARIATVLAVIVAATATCVALAAGAADPRDKPSDATLIELVERRTARSKTFAAGDGRRVTRIYAEAIHSRTPEGNWAPLEPRFTAGRTRQYEASGAAGFAAGVPELLADSSVDVRRGDDIVRLELIGAGGSAIEIDGAQATYPSALPGVSVSYHASAHALKEDLTLHGRGSPRTFDFMLRLSQGLTPRLVRNRVEITDEDGHTVFELPAPFMFERGDPSAISSDVHYGLHYTEDGWRLSVAAGDGWLDDPERDWPVVVDPTVQRPTAELACAISKDDLRWRLCDGASLHVGQLTNLYRSLLKFEFTTADGSPIVPAGESIDTAALVMHETSRGVAPADVWAHPVRQVWDGGLTWKMATASTQWSTGTGGNYDDAVGSVVRASTLETLGPVEWDISAIAQRWVTTPSANHGVLLKGGEASGSGVTFAGTTPPDPAKRPYLEISHDVVTAPENTVATPTEGDFTGRRIGLQGSVTTDTITGIEWEFKSPAQRHWQRIPASAMRTARGAAVTWPMPLTHSTTDAATLTADLTWDVTSTPMDVQHPEKGLLPDGPVKVRARYVGPGGGVTRKTVNIRLDRKDLHRGHSEPVGPGYVNLLTGNFWMEREDVVIASFKAPLGLARTFQSRGENRRTSDMFGPGWESSAAVDGPAMRFRGIYSFTDYTPGEPCYEPDDLEPSPAYEEEPPPDEWPLDDPDSQAAIQDEVECHPEFQAVEYAVLEHIDGKRTKYRIVGNRFIAADESNTLALTRIDATHLVVTDEEGNRTLFYSAAAGAPEYRPYEYQEAAATNETRFTYETITENGQPKLRLSRAIAPAPDGASCPGSNETAFDPRACRRLRFDYASADTAKPPLDASGPYPNRLVGVYFRSYDTTTSAFRERRVMTYHYGHDGRLRKAFDPRLPTDPETGEPPGETYTYDALGRIVSVARGSDRPFKLLYDTPDTSDDSGRLIGVSRFKLDGSAGTENTTTVVYNVPVSGTGAPHDMSHASTTRWGQTEGRPGKSADGTTANGPIWNDVPFDATAVFPPDPASGDGVGPTPQSYARATIHYMDRQGAQVNVASPNGGISFTGHDQYGNVIRQLTATNRLRVVAGAGDAAVLSAISTYDYSSTQEHNRGVELTRRLGPRHTARLDDGTVTSAREETRVTYDVDAPNKEDLHLPTKLEVGAFLDNGSRADVMTTTFGYTENGTNRGWELREPSEVVVDAGGLNLKTTTIHHPTEPLVIERRTPAATGGDDANVTQLYYYGSSQVPTSHSGVQHSSCKFQEQWYGMPCLIKAADSPGETPTRTVTKYDYLLQPEEEVTEGRNGAQKVHREIHDVAGRVRDTFDTGSAGQPLSSTVTTYDAATGRRSTVTAGSRIVRQEYDRFGRPTKYTDANGNVSVTTYDRLDRPATTTDGKGTQTRTYDATTGLLTRLHDASIGTFTAAYDADGRIVEETLPNGLLATRSYDEAGSRTSLSYRKPGCTGGDCVWMSSTAKVAYDGSWVEFASTQSKQRFAFDGAGRLTDVEDVAGGRCAVREYDYDADSHRVRSAVIPPLPDGACSHDRTRGEVRSHAYSPADRISDTGFVHDDLGRITRAPGAAANGGDLTASYYANDLARTLSQDGVTQTYELDPERRTHARTTSSSSGTTTTAYRYSDDSDNPAWLGAGANWTRFVKGIDGELAAIETSDGEKVLQLRNLRGDVVGEATLSTTATAPSALFDVDEFGVPRTSPARRYGFLGSSQRSAELASGVVQMGVRTYMPSLGRFLSTDPVFAGSANHYDYANQDPVNALDLDGRHVTCTHKWKSAHKHFYKKFYYQEIWLQTFQGSRDVHDNPGRRHIHYYYVNKLGRGTVEVFRAQVNCRLH